MQIIEMVDPPPKLVEIINRECADIPTVKSVVFGAYMLEMKNAIGCFCPDDGTIYLDLGNAMQHQALVRKCMMFVPAVWFNVLWAFYHELEHASQLDTYPDLIMFDKLPQEWEDMANKAALELILEWSENNTVPEIGNMGWIGKQLIVMINDLYPRQPELADEPHLAPLGAVAYFEEIVYFWKFTDNAANILKDEIDNGQMGVKIGNKRFITAYEFFGL